MQKEVNKDITQLLENGGYVRVEDNEAGARFVRGSDVAYVSGYLLILRCNGMTRPFTFEYALKHGMFLLEKLVRVDSQNDLPPGKRENYSLWIDKVGGIGL